MKKSPLFYTSLSLAIILGLVIGGYIFGEWRVPTQPPPGGNVDLSVFSSDWIKSGNDIYYDKGNVGIGTSTPSYPLEIGNQLRVWGQLISKVASGTAPFVIDSPTLVNNLNADTVDGYNAADLLGGGGGGGAVSITSITTPCTITGGSGYFTTSDICPNYGPERFIWNESGLSDSDSDGCPESANIPGFCIVRGPNGWIEPKYNQQVIVDLRASPLSSCGPSTNVILTWSTINASSCTASGGWSGTKATSGTETITNLTNTTSFTLSCTGSQKQPGEATVVFTKIGTCSEIVLYRSQNPIAGSNLKIRSTVDSYCDLETALGCQINRAFISLTSEDEIRDMPANYGVPTILPIYSVSRDGTLKLILASNWTSILSGSINNMLSSATINTTPYAWWAMSTYQGVLNLDNCITGTYGYYGNAQSLGQTWMAQNNAACTNQYWVLCLCVR